MGMTEIIASAVQTAFTAAGNLVATFTLTQTERGDYDPQSGIQANASFDYFFAGLIDKREMLDAGEGTSKDELRKERLNVIMRPGATTPMVGDLLRLGHEAWRISAVEKVAPNGTALLFNIEAISE